jgi:hypothetical protein
MHALPGRAPPKILRVSGSTEQINHHHGDLYEQLARIGKVVMHPKRIELLDLDCQAERTVESLAEATGLKLTTAFAHLQVMC